MSDTKWRSLWCHSKLEFWISRIPSNSSHSLGVRWSVSKNRLVFSRHVLPSTVIGRSRDGQSWNSAEAFIQGHDFKTKVVFRLLLDESSSCISLSVLNEGTAWVSKCFSAFLSLFLTVGVSTNSCNIITDALSSALAPGRSSLLRVEKYSSTYLTTRRVLE
jgi:hypothetical protein